MISAPHKPRPTIRRLGPAVAAALGVCAASLPQGSPRAGDPPGPHDALILEENVAIEVRSLDRARVRYRNRTQVLTGRGVDLFDHVDLLYSPASTFWKIDGSVRLPSGKVNKKGVSETYDGFPFGSYELYSDTRRKILSFTGLVPGAIAEYSYEEELTNLFFLREDIFLQEPVPSRSKSLTVTVARGVPVRFDVVGAAPEHQVEEGPEAVTHRWRVTDAPPFKSEPGAPPAYDLRPRIGIVPEVIQWGQRRIEASTWGGVARFYHDLAEEPMRPGPQVVEQARAIAGSATDPMDKARLVYEFVQGRVNYVAIQLGIGGYQPHDSTQVLRLRYGDCKDKATLMTAMLRSLGVPALPVLVRTRDTGLLSGSRPSTAFNHVIVALPEDGAYLFADPTSTTTPFGDLPWVDQGASALIVKPDGTGEFVVTPLAPPARNRRDLDLRARLDARGDLTGTLVIREHGQRSSELLGRLREDRDQESEAVGDLLAATLPGAQMKRHAVELAAAADGEVRVTVEFEIPHYLTQAGPLEFMPRSPERIASLAPLGKLPHRTQPLFVPYLSEDVVTSRIELPPGRTLKRVPDDAEITGPGAVARWRVRLEAGEPGRVLHTDRTVTLETREVPVAEWAAFRSFLAAVADQESRALTIVTVSGDGS